MRLQSTNPQRVHRSNDAPLTASIGPDLASFLSLPFASSLIQSTDQQHGPSIHLRSIDASRCSILRFSLTSGTGTFSDHIEAFPGRSIDQSMDRQSICSPILGQNPPVSFKCLNLQSTITIYGPSMGRRAVNGLCGSNLHSISIAFCVSVFDNFPAKPR